VNCACGNELTGKQRRWCSDTCSKDGARAARLRAIFDISPEDYDAILAEQGGVCAVCGREPTTVFFPVDHSHRTGLVRGVICSYCNLRVVAKHTDPHLLQRAADYLRDPPARRALGRDVVAPGRPKKKRKPRTTRRKKAA
jgi:hypothetical protein